MTLQKQTSKVLGIFIVFVVFISCYADNKTKGEPVTKENELTEKADPLPSWNDGGSKKAIMEFVAKVTKEGSADFIPESDRISCFDNDGTLWSEQPMYFQLAFAIDRIKILAPDHPEWKTKQPFKALLEGDMKTVMAGGEKALMDIVMTTHAGMTTEEFDGTVKDWIKTAKHPKTGKHYNEMIYQPMVELLEYLRANGFKTFIVSGGGIDFMRPWVEQAYGIPPDQVVGSSGKVKYEVVDGKPVIHKLPEINFVDDKEGKPVGIHQYIGKRPVFAAGNSDGDYAMLQWTSTATGYPRFGMLVHHTDSIREYAYDSTSHIGQLKKGLTDAGTYNWQIVDMKQEWNRVYPE
jgi:phosphoglycolate phosphatase-like HAD superfamily hydrolase